MTITARYWKNYIEYETKYNTVAEAAEEMLTAWSMGWLSPIGIWVDGEKTLCKDDILEWG